jgi:hypothetical protein
VFFNAKSDFCKKNFGKIFAMSATVPQWGGGFESRFLAKSEICGIFHCILRKLCFSATPYPYWGLGPNPDLEQNWIFAEFFAV